MKKFWGLTILLACVLFLVPPCTVQAANENVTSTMKNKANVRELSGAIANYTTMCMAESTSAKKISVKLNARTMLSLAAYVAYRTDSEYQYTKKEIQTYAYDLFGKKPGVSKLPLDTITSTGLCIAKSTQPNTKPYRYTGGDWGEYKPSYSIKKVMKVGKNLYDVTIANRLGNYSSSKTKKMGTTVIRIKRNKKSSYGFVIKKLSYKGNTRTYSSIDWLW